MILSDLDIEYQRSHGDLFINPWRLAALQPASYELHLGPDLTDPATGQGALIGQSYRFLPQQFMLATTEETIGIPPTLVAEVSGKSSLGRRGLLVHITAGFVDPGFSGELTLELLNISNRAITLHTGMAIAQLVFTRLSSPARRPYGSPGLGSHYQNQTGPTLARS